MTAVDVFRCDNCGKHIKVINNMGNGFPPCPFCNGTEYTLFDEHNVIELTPVQHDLFMLNKPGL